MKNYIIYAVIGFIFILIGGFVGYHIHSDPERMIFIERVPIEINFDSLKAVWLAGKADSVLIDQKDSSIAILNNMLERSLAHPDTIIIPGEPSMIASRSFDTTLSKKVHGIIVQGKDTTKSESQTNIKTKIHYIPSLDIFKLEKLDIAPFTLLLEKNKEVITIREPNIFGITGLVGGMGRAAIGGLVRVDRFSIGGMAIHNHQPLWLVGMRIIEF